MTDVCLRVPDHVLVRVVDSELVVLNLHNDQYYGLDPVGTVIWESITTAASVRAAMQDLLEHFDVDEETLAADVQTLIDKLRERGLIVLGVS